MILSIAILLTGVGTVYSAHHENDKTTAADVRENAAATYDSLKRYSAEQRDEAMTATREKLAKLDAEIAELQNRLDNRWQDMSKASREKSRAALMTLQQKRKDVAEWYGGMRHSSADAWESVKKGFAESYDSLEKAFKEAKEDFVK